jgi:DNA helicase-2/ATP-dependent DNA helicase PcrA
MEEEMFPYRGVGPGASQEELAEERRLAYVAITRARRQLVFSYAIGRTIFGTSRYNPPSRFLLELPPEVLSQPVTSLSERSVPGARPVPARGFSPTGPGGFARGVNSGRAGGGEIRVEYDDPEASPEAGAGAGFRRGMRVKHAKFGVGRVEQVERGPEIKLTVYFPGIGASKKLLAEFLQPL